MLTKILLADDHQIMRQGLRALLETQRGMKIVGETADGQKTVLLARELEPDVVLMDIGMPELNGIEATRQIINNNGKIKVIGLSLYSAQHYVVEMLRAGAVGYIIKDSAFDEVTLAIRTVMLNKNYLSPEIAKIVVDECLSPGPANPSSAFSLLTDREREVLQQLTEGNTTKEIAAKLYVSVKTVETHRSHIMKKLNLHSVARLTKYAVREGLTSLEN